MTGHIDPNLSRGLWLVKWILAIPHYIVLAFLWIGFIVATLIAGVAILFTGRYPAPLFEFTTGVLRWSWRVAFYSHSVLGTDKYPPFTLGRADYPATLEVAYPAKLSNLLPLVKPWLLVLPHLLIVGALTTGVWASSPNGSNGLSLLGLLVIVAGVILLFSGVYRIGLFNLLMGLNRWIFRTYAYMALMTDVYPPFRLDQGELDRTDGDAL